MLKLALGLDFVVVPFAGGGPHDAVAARRPHADCLRRDRQFGEPDQGRQAARARGHLQEALGGTPDVPTLEEAGIKGQEAETMSGVFVPAGTPKPIVDLLQRKSRRSSAPRHQGAAAGVGVDPKACRRAEFTAYIKSEIAKWKKVIKDAKIPLIGG